MIIKTFILFFLLSILLCCSKEKNYVESQLQTLLDSTLKQYPKAVGIILSIEAPDEGISWSGATGYSNRESETQIQADQPGNIASITKLFVSVAIFRLIEEGKLQLEQPIAEVIPERTGLLLVNNGYQPDSIQIGHLLSHKGGIPGIETSKWKEKESTDQGYRWTRDEQLRDAIIMNERGEIGKEWSYSDVNYLILSEIIEQVTGTSFYLALRELLRLDDLGIRQTWFYTLEKDPEKVKTRIHQYKENRNWASTYEDSPTWGLYGPSGIVSTTEDLANFSKALFGHEIYRNKNTLELMFTDIPTSDGKQIEYIHQDTIQMNYYMGLEEISTSGIHAIGHHGYWGSWMAYFPEENVHIGLFVLNADVMDQFEMKMMRDVLVILKN